MTIGPDRETVAPVVVAGLYLPGVSLLRDFEQRGIRCIGIDCAHPVVGFHSRYGEKRSCPDPSIHPEAWLDFMLDLGRRIGSRSVLLATADKFVLPIETYRDALKEHFTFPHPPRGLNGKLTNKRETFRLAAEHGFPIPKTGWPRTEDELRSFASDARFPCLIKPEFSTSWADTPRRSEVHGRKVVIAQSPDELISAYRRVVGIDRRLVVQEVIQGPDENLVYFVSYLDREQKMLGCFAGRKVRVVPIHFGSASYVITTPPADLEGPCHEFLRAIGYWGICGIEVKQDAHDGVWRLVEINPRFGMWDALGRQVGVDLADLEYRDLLGLRVEPVRPRGPECRWVSLKRDARAFLEYRREKKITLRSWLASLRKPIVWADLSMRDWPITVFFLFDIARAVWRRILWR